MNRCAGRRQGRALFVQTGWVTCAANGTAMEHCSHETGRGLGAVAYTGGAGIALVLMEELLDGTR